MFYQILTIEEVKMFFIYPKLIKTLLIMQNMIFLQMVIEIIDNTDKKQHTIKLD